MLLDQYCTELQAGMQVIVADHVELVDSWFQEAIADVGATVLLLFPHHGLSQRPQAQEGRNRRARGAMQEQNLNTAPRRMA